MSKNVRITEPSAEMQIKIRKARSAIASQKQRYVKCPYCTEIFRMDSLFYRLGLKDHRHAAYFCLILSAAPHQRKGKSNENT